MRERRKSPTTSVELQQINNLSINKNKILDKPPAKSIIKKIENNLYDTSDPKVEEYQPIAQPFDGYISPLNPYLLLWDATVIFAMYVFYFEMGFLLAFTSDFWIGMKSYVYTLGLYITLLAIFLLDMGVNFVKGFYQFGKGHIVI